MKLRYSFPIFIVSLFAFSLAHAINIKDVTFKVPKFGRVIFDHNLHFKQEGIKNNCKICHNAIFDLRKKARYTMADMEKGKSCGACHNGKSAFDVKDCGKCHMVPDLTIKVKETGPVTFRHKKHMVAYKCGSCHPKLYLPSSKNKRRTMAEMEAAQSCGACHDGNSAFTVRENCEKCHKM